MKFLIVDDCEDARMFSVMKLKQAFPGAEYIEAENGVQALSIYAFTKPDVVVTDRSTPYMDGEELAKAIRSKNLVVPIFLVTGDCENVKDPSLFTEIFSKGKTDGIAEAIKLELEERRTLAPRQGAK